VEINFDLTRPEIESLLSAFLVGTQGLELTTRITEMINLPEPHLSRVRCADSLGQAWIAWITRAGPIVAWGAYDIDGSRRINAYLLFIEWCRLPNDHHSAWCYCHPSRPTEWVFGRKIEAHS
jgi:hypothetical protein